MLSNRVIVSRLMIAVVLGGIIGLDREKNNRAAGLRTHILVAVGSTLIMIISIDASSRLGIEARWDVGRLAAQVVSGIGFLGAGTILHNDGKVNGLTTAASLWLTAAIGLAVGIGYYLAAVFSNFIVLITLNSLKKIEARIGRENGERVDISFYKERFNIDLLVDECYRNNIKINRMKFNKQLDKNSSLNSITLCLKFPEDLDKKDFFNCFLASKKVEAVKYEDLNDGELIENLEILNTKYEKIK